MKKAAFFLTSLFFGQSLLFAFPAEFPLDVGKYAIWRGVRASHHSAEGTPIETVQKQEFFLRVAVVGKEIVKERRKRKTKQVYYWIEYNLNNQPSQWADGQNLKVRIHEEDLKKGVFPKGEVEYILQMGKTTPTRQVADFSSEFSLFWPLLILSPPYSLAKTEIGKEKFRYHLQEGEGKIFLYQGENVEKSEMRERKEKVTGKTLLFPGIPFGVVWLQAVYEEMLFVGKANPRKMVMVINLQLEQVGENAQSEVTG
ncbi:MAG: hypothetical protein V2G48_01250 [bacterium JZ-2024 1]